MLMTTAMLLLGGIASALASLYEGTGGLSQAGDLVVAVSTTAGLVLTRSARRS
jgi:hypothetical protein